MIIPPRVSFWLVPLIVVFPGLVGACMFCYYTLVDWHALQSAYTHYEQTVARPGTDLRVVFVAEAEQNIHRINLFADGVWTLLSAIFAAVGLNGICLLRAGESRKK